FVRLEAQAEAAALAVLYFDEEFGLGQGLAAARWLPSRYGKVALDRRHCRGGFTRGIRCVVGLSQRAAARRGRRGGCWGWLGRGAVVNRGAGRRRVSVADRRGGCCCLDSGAVLR